MVQEVQKEDTSTSLSTSKKIYQCQECGFQYEDDSTSLITGKEWAEKCGAWCKERKGCNLIVVRHSVSNNSV